MLSSSEEAKRWKEIAERESRMKNQLLESLEKFLKKNFNGGSKADREDYTTFVTCKDIYDLYICYKETKDEQFLKEGKVLDTAPVRSCLEGKEHNFKVSSHSDGVNFYTNKYTCENCRVTKTERFER